MSYASNLRGTARLANAFEICACMHDQAAKWQVLVQIGQGYKPNSQALQNSAKALATAAFHCMLLSMSDWPANTHPGNSAHCTLPSFGFANSSNAQFLLTVPLLLLLVHVNNYSTVINLKIVFTII